MCTVENLLVRFTAFNKKSFVAAKKAHPWFMHADSSPPNDPLGAEMAFKKCKGEFKFARMRVHKPIKRDIVDSVPYSRVIRWFRDRWQRRRGLTKSSADVFIFFFFYQEARTLKCRGKVGCKF